MAEAQGYDIDIFLSYSRRDNEPIGSRPGWVDVFQESLENWLVKRRGLENLKIWRDTAGLQGNTDFDDAIGNRLKGTALFFVLNSRSYPKSEYCRKELEWFHRFNSERPGGLKIGEQHRIFNILLNNIPHSQWPDQLQGAVGFPMHDSEGKDALGDFTLPEDDTFVRQLHRIVNAVEETLNGLAKAQPASPPAASASAKGSDAARIFIADAADSLFQRRERLVADLQGRGIEVFEEIPPPMEAEAHGGRIRDVLEKAALSVHLLDQWPGRRILDNRATTYSRAQIDAALASDTPQLIWTPSDLKLDLVEDHDYREFLETLESGDRGGKNYEFIRSPLADFTEIVAQKLAEAGAESGVGDELSILVDTHQKDQRFGFKIADLLAEKGVEVEFNQESVDPVRSLEQFEYAVRNVKNLVIMFGQVAPEWLQARIKKAVRIAAEQFASDEGDGLEGIWVYALPGAEQVPQFPRIPFRIEVLDNSQGDSINPSVMAPLLGV